MTAEILKSCQLVLRYRGPSGDVPTHVKATSGVLIDVAAVPELTVGAVRAVFGKETRWERDTGETMDGNPVAVTTKGSLRYEDILKAAAANSDVEESRVTFVVRLPKRWRGTSGQAGCE
ncbi:MAG: hypothetical protein ACREU6_13140 [Steroidobacteraceae bacterium]